MLEGLNEFDLGEAHQNIFEFFKKDFYKGPSLGVSWSVPLHNSDLPELEVLYLGTSFPRYSKNPKKVHVEF